MKNLHFVATCGIIAVFIMSCVTSQPEMISNSFGYDYNSQREEILLRRDMRPDWFKDDQKFKDDQNRREWEEKNNEGGTILFFYGENRRTPAEVAASGLTVWSVDQASEQAFQDILRQISRFIDNNIKLIDSDFVVEVTETQTTGQSTQASTQKIKESQAQATYSSQFESKSSATFNGLNQNGLYTETWVEEIKKNKIIVTRVWMVYGITKTSISEAKREIDKKRQEEWDDKRRLESLENKEEVRFEELAWKYKVAIEGLNKIDFSKPDSEKQLKEKYDELNHIRNEMGTLSTLKRRNDAIGQEYINLMTNIANDISKINPTDRHFTIIENLQRQVTLRDGEINGLRNSRSDEIRADLERIIAEKDALMEQIISGREGYSISSQTRADLERIIAEKDALMEQIITGRQGYSISSQTYILSFPQKPNETLVSAADIYAANEMVSNMDYISFTSINGRGSFSRGEYGLNAPVISISWNEAALYCNWLSKLYGYTPCYTELKGQITGYDKKKNGYRLPEHDEIIVILETQPGIISETEFTQIGIWSSDGDLSEPTVYILSDESGQMNERYKILSLGKNNHDWEIGFRVVRNAK